MIVEARDRLKNTLANSQSFQTLVGAVGHPELAIKRVHIDAVSPEPKEGENYSLEELNAIRPYALIYYAEEGYRWVRDAMGVAGETCWGQETGDLMCELYRNTPEGDAQDVAVDFALVLAGIAGDVINSSEQPGGLFINGFTFNGPYRTSEEEYAELGDSQGALMTFSFGNTQSDV